MKDHETPLKLVRQWSRTLPGCYDTLDSLRDMKSGGEASWPDFCTLPINAAYSFLTLAGIPPYKASELTACWLWRQSKIIYHFNPELTVSLAEQATQTDDTDILPAELLLHPPYPIIYVKCPKLVKDTDGFFYWVDYDMNHSSIELRIQWVSSSMDKSFAQVLHLLPGQTIRDCVQDTVDRINENFEGQMTAEDKPISEAMESFFCALQLILYLVSEGAEIKKPASEKKPVKKRSISDTISEVKDYPVGIRIGAALKKARIVYEQERRSEGSGGTKRPHSRRGHWHHYWAGPRDGERRLILKWTAPTFIHAETKDDSIVVHPVRGEKNK